MIQLEAVSPRTREVPLGDYCEFALTGHPGPIEAEFFVKHEGIHYLHSLSPRVSDGIRFHPEAPGRYVLYARWRTPDGGAGWAEASFEVVAGRRFNLFPQIVQVDADTKLWFTSQWEALQVPGYDKTLMRMASHLVKRNAVVYDIGSNVGLYAVRFARLAGRRGHVYCVEANPVCVYLLRANMELNQVENYEILPVAVAKGPGSTRFTINYANLGLGLIEDSPYFGQKSGHGIDVDTTSLDDLIETQALRPPDVIKLDIEGGEVSAVKGMLNTLLRHRPILILELHGQVAARGTLEGLESAGYRYQELASGQAFADARAAIDWFPDAVLQVVGRPI
ncbi:MAG TPA: FkbM family methyltransferase [Methylomirabilota bacterium]|jgi:FkbM family methyltransferase|nr:FkbM family methyltransferase [Methylomirabilota bacterium]